MVTLSNRIDRGAKSPHASFIELIFNHPNIQTIEELIEY